MDRARSKTNKLLKELEQRISEIYVTDPSLLYVQKRYHSYMDMVKRCTEDSYDAYINETDPNKKEKLKKVYTDKVRALTLKSLEYKSLVDEIVRTMSDVNQRALDVTNNVMTDVYTLNYNQVAVDCKKVGINVNG